MSDNKLFVSYTKLATFKTCPMKYYFKYIQKLSKKVTKKSFYVGEDIHILTELFYVHRSPKILELRRLKYNEYLLKRPELPIGYDPDLVPPLPPEWEEFKKGYDKWEEKALAMYGAILTWRQYVTEVIIPRVDKEADSVKHEIGYNYVNDLIKIMGQYEYYYWNDKMIPLNLESKKYADLGTFNGIEVVLSYISDGIVQVGEDIYLLEHKSFSTDPMSFEDTWLDVQTASYVTELRKEGWNIKGVIWDNIKSKAPKDPNILKSKKYGKQYSDNTLFSFISSDVIMKGPEAVVEEAKKSITLATELNIVNNYQNFLTRHVTVFNEDAVKAINKDSNSVIDIITREEFSLYRNMGWSSCNFCSYKDLCQMEMLGHDTSHLIDTIYVKGDY